MRNDELVSGDKRLRKQNQVTGKNEAEIKSKATRPIGHVAFIYHLLITNFQTLRDFQFLQLGFAYDTVIPTAGGVVFFEHVVQFANMAD